MRTFEIIGGIIILIFMSVVLLQIFDQNESSPPDTRPPVDQTEPRTPIDPVQVAVTLSSEEFKFQLEEAVRIENGQPIEGFEPMMFMQVFSGLETVDFDGVDAQIGHYEYNDGVLEHELGNVDMIHSAAGAITEIGIKTLLGNVIDRLEIDPNTTSAEGVAERLRHKDSPTSSDDLPIACTMDAKQCSDGSYVGRTGPDCEFIACPSDRVQSEAIECTPESKQVDACIEIYAPVCGQVEVQCITSPCNPVPETFSNSCFACAEGNVLLYTEGECEAY